MKNLRGKDVHNGALVALDYQTGQIVAYVGCADYYSRQRPRRSSSPSSTSSATAGGSRDRRSSRSTTSTGIDDKTMTAASMFMDVTTDFGGGYSPTDADNLERGPVRVRNALQFSLNIPSVKALGHQRRPSTSSPGRKDFGMAFQTDTPTAGLRSPWASRRSSRST